MNEKLPAAIWRLIVSEAQGGSDNMATDEAILEAVGRGAALPTLRLYRWDPPCLSLGYAQKIRDVDRQALQQAGWTLVRRPTGGRAILHTDELTYAVIAPADEPRLAGGVLESYRRLGAALIAALERLQVPARTEEKHSLPPGSNPHGPVCFEVPADWEITVDGKKLIGSAQTRRKKAVLQHGTLPLCGDLARITRVLRFADGAQRAAAAERLLGRATTVEQALHRPASFDEAARAFVLGFQSALNLSLKPGALSSAESRRAAELVAKKYANPAWTART